VFGRGLAREVLASLPVRVAIAGRDARRLARACRALKADDRVEPLYAFNEALFLSNTPEVRRRFSTDVFPSRHPTGGDAG